MYGSHIDIRCPRCGAAATLVLSLTAKLRNTPGHLKNNVWNVPGTWGECLCVHCVGRFDHLLNWPADAWWVVRVPDGDLWAQDRRHAGALIAYLEDERPHPKDHPGFCRFLTRVPGRFLRPTRRRKTALALRKMLNDGPAHASGRGGGARVAARG